MIPEGDIRIRILGGDKDSVYPIEAQTDDGSFFTDQMQLADPQRATLAACEGDNQQYGARLAQLLFGPQILYAYNQTLGRARAAGSGRVRIRLWISNASAELHEYAWERLFLQLDGNQVAVASTPAFPFSRYTGLARPEPQALRPRGGRLRVLVALSNPTELPAGFASIPVRNELIELLAALQQVDGITVTVLPGRTSESAEEFADFSDRAREWQQAGFDVRTGATTTDAFIASLAKQDIIYFLGHGAYSRKTGGSVLFLENGDGSAAIVKDDEIVSRIIQLSPLPQLLFLASCDSAKRPEGDSRAFVSVGPKLVEAGFPAVVAMQAKVPMELAHRLTLEFFRNLLDHGTIDLALNQARSLLYSNQGADWSIPVLFMRVPNGRLFAPDPVRAALHAIAEGPAFVPKPMVDDLPLEAVVLRGQQLPENKVPAGWGRAVSTALYRVDLLKQVQATAMSGPPETAAYNLTLLVGDRGAEKAGFLGRLVRETALHSLENREDRPVLPVYVDLDTYPLARPVTLNRLETLLLASVQPFWPYSFSESDLSKLLAGKTPTLRIVLNNGDDLVRPMRDQILDDLQKLIDHYPQHQYFFAMERGCWDLDRIRVTVLVDVQPLSRHKLESFLRGQTGELQPAMTDLAKKLATLNLYDLAAMPWLLLRMVDQARQGRLPESRAQVLQLLVDDGVQKIPVERGQQSRARESLYALALQMQSTFRNQLPPQEAFEALASVRRNREYNLEELLVGLLDQDLLQQTTEGAVRFPYSCIQSFCCARALQAEDEKKILEQITAGLGRPKYLRWWDECLILLSGLSKDPVLLKQITFGSTLTEGEHLFLAARALQESGLAKEGDLISDQILDALIWRTDSANEDQTKRRVLAVRALAQLPRPEVLAHLTRIARDKIRRAWDGKMEFEYGSVRHAAVRALYRLPQFWEQVGDKALIELFQQWRNEDVEPLANTLATHNSTADGKVSLSGVAAFALGDLQFDRTAREALYSSLISPLTDKDTRWSIADALLSFDPHEVIDRILRPSIDKGSNVGPPDAEWNHLMLYLISQLRPADTGTLVYVESFLKDPAAIAGWKGRALLALGMLNAQQWRNDLVNVALGDFTSINAREDDPESVYLRQKALEALAEVGTMVELKALRAARKDVGWTSGLIRVFYSTSEIISSRESEASMP